ncbi:hypothetical protein [Hellea balneolensis]|uniref:hypothetical protein n=1 Tax=Hellea balneolensis TaxID=287478 RepID=UPI0004032159|nr:hypothetical protein [Hellea balneolensis]
MQDYWEVLGLDEPPADLKSAKRAYAAQLKVTRPDDDPEGFMLLRDALEIAKQDMYHKLHNAELEKEAQTAQNQTVQDDVSEFLHEDQRPENSNEVIKLEAAPTEAKQLEYPRFYPEIQEILNDPILRNDKNAWEQLIEKARETSIDDYIDFDILLRRYLLDLLGYYDGDAKKHNRNRKPSLISSFIATYIFKAMEWHKASERDYETQAELNWLQSDLDVIRNNKAPGVRPDGTKTVSTTEDDGMSPWVIIGIFIAGLQVLRLLVNGFSGNGF